MKSDDKLTKLLAHLEAKLVELEAVGNIGTWEYLFSDQKLTWSIQMYKIFGRNPDQGSLLMEDFYSHIHMSDQLRWELLINKVSIDGLNAQVELRIFDTDDQMKWISKWAKGLYQDGKLIGLQGICQDITEFKILQRHYDETKNILKK